VLDFMVAARGYGMALALMMAATALLLGELSRPSDSPRRMMEAGAALALSVTANLVFVLPAAALVGIAVLVMLRRRPTPVAPLPQQTHKKKTKKKAAPSASKPAASRQPPAVLFAIPISHSLSIEVVASLLHHLDCSALRI